MTTIHDETMPELWWVDWVTDANRKLEAFTTSSRVSAGRLMTW